MRRLFTLLRDKKNLNHKEDFADPYSITNGTAINFLMVIVKQKYIANKQRTYSLFSLKFSIETIFWATANMVRPETDLIPVF